MAEVLAWLEASTYTRLDRIGSCFKVWCQRLEAALWSICGKVWVIRRMIALVSLPWFFSSNMAIASHIALRSCFLSLHGLPVCGTAFGSSWLNLPRNTVGEIWRDLAKQSRDIPPRDSTVGVDVSGRAKYSSSALFIRSEWIGRFQFVLCKGTFKGAREFAATLQASCD